MACASFALMAAWDGDIVRSRSASWEVPDIVCRLECRSGTHGRRRDVLVEWVEDPGYPNAHNALLAAGARLVPVPVDEAGIVVEAGIARAPQARMAYITPSHQFPLGAALSLKRRLAILDWAKRANAYILEDDYDGEYRFDGRPLAALQGLDDHGSVIYIGTFSKVLFPALRIGYLIIPTALVDAFIAMRRALDASLPRLEQAVLAEFIAEGHFTRHIRRMRTLYAERRAALLQEPATCRWNCMRRIRGYTWWVGRPPELTIESLQCAPPRSSLYKEDNARLSTCSRRRTSLA